MHIYIDFTDGSFIDIDDVLNLFIVGTTYFIICTSQCFKYQCDEILRIEVC